MAISGKGSLSIKKKDLLTQKAPALGFKSLKFWHKATAGDTGIDLTALNFPSAELPSESNPTSAEIASAKLLFNKPNVTIKSSVRGELLQTSYSIPHNGRISFEGFTADDGEIFEVTVANKAQTGLKAVDAQSIVATGTLAAGQTDFAVGTPFELNKYPNEQVGAVLVYLDGLLQFRNVGNAAASPTADGNYEEVDSGDGKTSNLIRFNSSSASDRQVMIVSNGLLVQQPDDSRDAALQSLAATVDQVVEDLAVATGNPESRYQVMPSQVDLKQFGNRVLTAENDIVDIKKVVDTTNSEIKAKSTNAFSQAGNVGEHLQATLGANLALSDNVFTDVLSLTLNPGHWYVACWGNFQASGSASNTEIIFYGGVSTTSGAHDEPYYHAIDMLQPNATGYRFGFNRIVSLSAQTTVYFEVRYRTLAGTAPSSVAILAGAVMDAYRIF